MGNRELEGGPLSRRSRHGVYMPTQTLWLAGRCARRLATKASCPVTPGRVGQEFIATDNLLSLLIAQTEASPTLLSSILVPWHNVGTFKDLFR